MELINAVIRALGEVISFFLDLLPDSPFQKLSFNLGEVMGYVNYFIPVGMFVDVLGLYLAAVIVWYAVRWVLRFVRYIA